MCKLTLRKIDESNGYLDCEDYGLIMDVYEAYSYYMEGYMWHPLFKNKRWDGKIRLIKLNNRSFPLGLANNIKTMFGDKIEFDEEVEASFDSKYKEEEIKDYFSNFRFYCKNKEIYPRDDQMYAVVRSIQMNRCINICPTSFGKSLSIFLEYLWHRKFNRKCLIVVPSVDLTEQFKNDILDYCTDENGKLVPWVPKIHNIHGGKTKAVPNDANIVISTWQSIHSIIKTDSRFLEQFDVLILDECHKGSAKVLQTICMQAVTIKYRTGWTGSLKENSINSLLIEGLFGPIEVITDLKTLMDHDVVAQMKIVAAIFRYSEEESKHVIGLNYQQEIEYIEHNKRRIEKMCSIAGAMNSFGIILYSHISHGRKIYDELRKKYPERNIYLVHSGVYVCNDQKYSSIEEMKPLMESDPNGIVVAIFSIFSTGISIKNIRFIVFGITTKSFVRTVQSIGRALRVREDKNKAILIDIVDNFSIVKRKKDKLNYSMKHFSERFKIYSSLKLDYIMKEISM